LGTVLSPGTFSDTLSPANSTNAYRLNASAGDKYSFSRTAGSGAPNATWRLLDPYGGVLFSSALTTAQGPLTLAASGSYTLLVEGALADTGTGSYTLSVSFQGNVPPSPPAGTPLTLGATVSGSLTVALQQDRYTFTLAASALLSFDSLTNNGSL